MTEAVLVVVRRQWNDWRQAQVRLTDLDGLHWSTVSGGVGAPAPRPFMHGYVYCDAIRHGDLAHSCQHGPPPHRVKVCIVQKDNPRDLVARLKAQADAGGFR